MYIYIPTTTILLYILINIYIRIHRVHRVYSIDKYRLFLVPYVPCGHQKGLSSKIFLYSLINLLPFLTVTRLYPCLRKASAILCCDARLTSILGNSLSVTSFNLNPSDDANWLMFSTSSMLSIAQSSCWVCSV